MIQKEVLAYIRKYHMISPGEICLVGLSGGADSVCLLLLLAEFQEELQCFLQAVHINHRIRGAEAERDAFYCRKLCQEKGIPYYEYSYDVLRLAKENHTGTEEMGRRVRQEAYADCMKRHGAVKLALAHHQNDLAETFLFHLARGTSLGGLAAIRPVREHLIHPLLCINRQKIEQYVKERQVLYCEDSTNAGDDYTRNQIRHHVLAYLTERINPRSVEHISAVSEDILEVSEYLEEQAKKAEAEDTQWIRENQEEKVLLTGKLFQKPPLLQRMVILSVMERLCGKRKDITRIHVESVRKLYDHPVRKRVSLGYGMQAVRNYTNIEIFIENPRRESNGKGKKREEFIYLQDSLDLKWHDFSIQTAVTPYRGQRIVEKTYTKWLDYDKIKQNAVFRTRRSGDYLVINASGGRKKLKDYLIDNKIPQKERDSLLLLAQGSEVLWVVGYRMGESAKISENTKQMIEVHIGGNTNE